MQTPARILSLALCAIAPLAAVAQTPDPMPDAAAFMGQWCIDCHSGEKPSGQMDLSTFPKGFASPEATLAKCAKRLRAGEMPPKEGLQPPKADVLALLRKIDAAELAANRPGPGRVTIRRLSRYEYRNTIRDLLGIDPPSDDFPVDDVGYGFDNIGDVLSVSPLLLEKYAAAAEKIALEAIDAIDPDHPPKVKVEGKSMTSSLPDSFRGTARVLFKSGSAGSGFVAPRAGEYLVRASAYGDQAGSEKPKMILGADGTTTAIEVEVTATKDAPAVYELRAKLTKGGHKIGVAFMNDFYDAATKADRNLVIEWLEITGPLDRVEPPAAHRAIFASDPGGGDAAARLRAILPPLLLRAWRRPATADEIHRIVDLATMVIGDGARFERGVQVALQAILTSPNFLFRAEPDPPGTKAGAERDLNGWELASRLSYFLWSTLPDQRLLELAAGDRLKDPKVLREEVARMLDDPRASSLAENFAAQWLEVRNLADIAPDPERFPEFDEELRDAMRQETEMLFEAVLRERRPVNELVDAGFTFVNERLARHYGIPGVRGSHFRRVRAPADRGGGVLAHASVLTVTSNATRTSPVKRGKFVLDNILDAPPPAPPPGVGALDERPQAVKAATIRERMEKHRTDPSCSACHARIDGIGFALENYDPVGAWRTRDESAEVDASATLPDGRAFKGLAGLRKVIREEDALVRSLAKKLFVYAVGRGIESADERAIQAMIASFQGREPTLSDIILGIVHLDAFRRRST